LGFIDGRDRICFSQAPTIRTLACCFGLLQLCVAKHASHVFAENFGTLPKGRFGTFPMPLSYAVLPYTCRFFYILA